MSLRELYQEMIVDHGKTPRNFGKLSSATHQKMGHNPLCGDKLVLYVETNADKINNVMFEGVGCAICMASASLMTETIKSKTLTQIAHLFTQFHQLVTTGEASQSLGKLDVFSGVSEFPIRVKCASLPWHTLKAALDHNEQPVSTE